MRKFLLGILALSLICSFTFTSGALAADETVLNVLCTTPNTELRTDASKNKIGVNQEKIDILFDDAVADGYENITFTDSNGSTPKGGVVKTVSGDTVTLKFGELAENATYTLTIPSSVVSANGKYAEEKVYTFITIPKDLSEEDFSDAVYTAAGSATDAAGLQIVANKSATLTTHTADSGDKYLRIKSNVDANDIFIGANVGADLTTGKVISQMHFREANSKEEPWAHLGSMYGYVMGTGGYQHADFKYSNCVSAFTKNSDGFYNAVIISEKETQGASYLSGTKPYVKSKSTITAVDTLGSGFKTETLIKNNQVNDSKIYSVAALKMYAKDSTFVEDTIDISYLKQGFYTLPAIMIDNGYNSTDKTISYVMNTDLDQSTLENIKLDGTVVSADFDASTRILTLQLADYLDYGSYTVSFDGVKSADGFALNGTDVVDNNIVVSNMVIKDASTDTETTNISEVNNVKFEFDYKNFGTAKSVQAIIAIYHGNRLNDVITEDIALEEDESGKKFITYNGVEQSKDLKISAMLWDIESLRPVCNSLTKEMPGPIKLEAEGCDSTSTVNKSDFGGTATGGWTNGKYAVYKNVNLTPYHTKLTTHILPYQKGNIEVRANSVDGLLLGKIVITQEMCDTLSGVADPWSSKDNLIEITTALSGMTGNCDLYFISKGPSGCSTDWYMIEMDDTAID